MLREPIERLIRDPKEFTRGVSFPDPAQIRIYDETLRDGEQMPGVCYTPAQKLEIAKALAGVGVHIMSVGFPAASEGDRRTLQLVMEAKRRGELGDVEIVVMCRSNRNDIDVTVKTLRDVGVEPREVTFFIFTSGSDLHLKYKIGKTLLRYEGREEREWLDLPLSFYRAANIRLQCDAIRHARECGIERVEFGAEDGSRGDVDYFIEYFKAGLDAGGTRPAWPDTVGTLTPEATRWYCSRIVEALPEGLPIVAHLHNDYGLGTINAIVAASCGFKVISVTANGYGERAGNVKLHEFVVALRVLYGIELPGFKYGKAARAGALHGAHERHSAAAARADRRLESLRARVGHPHAGDADRSPHVRSRPGRAGRRRARAGSSANIPGAALVEDTLRRQRERLARAGVEPTPELAHRVTDEVKRLREERAASSKSEETMELYETAMRRLSLNEDDVVEIAIALGAPAKAS